MRRLTHPLTSASYEWADDGIGPVLVIDKSGRKGRFDRDGRWLSGALRYADPELCRWVVSGGPDPGGAAARSRRFDPVQAVPPTTTVADTPSVRRA